MIKADYAKKHEVISLKWKKYKLLRSRYPEKCTPGTPNFLDWRQREEMFEDVLKIIEFSKDV